MAKFTPMTDEEIAKSGLLPEGICDFEITACIEYKNEKGNDIFKLSQNLFDSEGNAHPRMDWITPAFIKKFKHCVDACGLLAKYEAGEILAEDFVGKSGKCKIKIGEPRTNKDGIEMRYNEIEDYVKRSNSSPDNAGEALEDDGIPF